MKMYTCPKHYFILLQFNIRQKLLGWWVQKGVVGGATKNHLNYKPHIGWYLLVKVLIKEYE